MPYRLSTRIPGVLVSLLLSASVTSSVSANNGSVAVAEEVQGILLDGDFQDWPSGMTRHAIARNLYGDAGTRNDDHEAWFQVGYDPSTFRLYLAVVVNDESFVSNENSAHWADSDGMGFGLGLRHGESGCVAREFGVRRMASPALINGADGPTDQRVQLAIQIDNQQRRYEWMVDLQALHAQPLPEGPFTCAFSININDRDEDGSFSVLYWSPEPYKLLDRNRFGDLIIGQRDEDAGKILGQVRFTEQVPFRHAKVRMQSVTSPQLVVDVQADSEGRFELFLPAGVYHRTLRCDGLGTDGGKRPNVELVSLEAGSVLRRDVDCGSASLRSEAFGPGETFLLGNGRIIEGAQVYDGGDNIPARGIRELARDSTGRLWLASFTGLAALELDRVTVYGIRDGLPAQEVHSIFYHPEQDTIYVGTEKGLCRIGLADQRVTVYPALLGRRVEAIGLSHDGQILAGTQFGLYRIAPETKANVEAIEADTSRSMDRLNVTCMISAQQRRQTWIGTDDGLWVWDGNKLSRAPVLQATRYSKIQALSLDQQGRLWVAAGGSILCCTDDKFQPIYETPTSHEPWGWSFATSVDGQQWVGTNDGLHRVVQRDDQSFEFIRLGPNHRHEKVTALLAGEDSLWVGTTDSRLLCLRRNLHTFDTRSTTAVATDSRGGLWYSTSDEKTPSSSELHHVGRKGRKTWKIPNRIMALDAGLDDCWIGTDLGGLLKIASNAEEWTRFDSDAQPIHHIRSIRTDPGGTTWIATVEGLYSLPPNTKAFERHTVVDGLPDSEVRDFAFDSQGRVYAATLHGLAVYENQTWTTVTSAGGIDFHFVMDVIVDDHDEVWLATPDGAVNLKRTGDAVLLHDNHAAPEWIERIHIDDRGIIWLTTPHGIDRYDGEIVQCFRNASIAGVDETVDFACHNGTVYLASESGLWSYTPPVEKPVVVIDQTLATGEIGNLRPVHSPLGETPYIELQFHAVSLHTRQEDMAYRYRWKGDEAWRISRQGSIRVTDPQPGPYELEIQAIDTELSRSEPVLAKFHVGYPIRRYLRIGAITGAASGFGLLLMVYVNRNRRTQHRLEQSVIERSDALQRETEEREKLQEELHHAAKMEALGTLATGIAHDFNNSLCAIGANAELAKMQDNPPATEEFLGEIMHVTELATGLSQSLLTFGGKARSEKLPTDLNQLIRSSMKIIARTLPSAIEVNVHVPPSPIAWCNLDACQMQQLLMNLTVNARDAMPHGGVLEVRLYVDAKRSRAMVRVSDSGSGIADEIRERIFEPFVSSKPRGQGTGLGLSIAHAVVTDHDGTIEVRSAPETGTTFTISFPLIAPPADQDPELTPSPDTYAGVNQGIAIVADDQPHVRRSIVTTLQTLGYEAITAANGRECLERVEQLGNVVDLVVLDIDMPIISGLDCLDRIRSKHPELKVVLITGLVLESLEELCNDSTRVLHKPFSLEGLAESIRFE